MSSTSGSISSFLGSKWAVIVAVVALGTGAIVAPAVVGGGGDSSCDSSLTTGQSIATALSGATAGDTICLGAGSYAFNAATSKASLTKVQLADGVTQAQVTISSLDVQNGANNLWFDGMTVGTSQSDWGNGSGSPTNLRVTNVKFTGPVCINSRTANANILIDASTFIGLDEGCNEGRIGVTGSSGGSDNGVTISNSEFSGGNSDAIQITNSARGTVIGPGNYFHDITSCEVHCDVLQPYGGVNTTFIGNYVHDVDGVIANFDCNGEPLHLIDNVIDQGADSAQAAVAISGANGDTLIGNTFSSTTEVQIYGGNGNCGATNQNMTIRDNVFHGGCSLSGGSSNTISFNLVTTTACRGTSGINGSPTFAGGSSPTTVAGFALAGGSAGEDAASDGQDMGAPISSLTGAWDN
jgi:hypothetical protein